MKRYIEQLIEDLRKARDYDDPPEMMEDFLIGQTEEAEDQIADVEEYLNGPRQPLSQILGIEKEKLPTPERLSDEQAEVLAGEMEKLWRHFRFYPSYPDDNFPGKVRYRLLRDSWDIDQVHLSTGAIGVEFCDYDEENCPVPGYCNACEEWKKEYDEVHDSQKKDEEESETVRSIDRDSDPEFRKKVEKAKELMKTMPMKEEYISGIYNYCDRWCEKCDFTSRCLNYAMGKEMHDDSEDVDINNKVFWDQLSVIFRATFEFLAEKAEEMGIYLDAEVDETEEELKEETDEEAIKNNPLIALAYEYSMKGHKWFEDNRESLKKAMTNISAVNENDLINLKDAVEIIQWYNFFIYVKLRRAMSSLRDDEEDPELAEMMAGHTNGTAKIALIATDRSIAAFGFLLENMRDKEDEILDFLAMLGKIRNMTEKIFPDARTFKRPGFDE